MGECKYTAHSTERKAHRALRSRRTIRFGEWYAMPPAEAIRIVNLFLANQRRHHEALERWHANFEATA